MTVSNDFTYKAKVKGLSALLSYNRVRFGISVGKEYHEGSKLDAALEWGKTHFDHIEVRVSDTLQRYNFSGHPDDNWTAARKAGDDWIKRNKPILDKYDIYLFRWDDVLQDPEFQAFREKSLTKINDPLFQEAMKKDALAYISRTGRDLDRSLEFLREELQVFDFLQEKRPAVDAYPATFLECRKLLRPDFALARIHLVHRPLVTKLDIAA